MEPRSIDQVAAIYAIIARESNRPDFQESFDPNIIWIVARLLNQEPKPPASKDPDYASSN